MNRISEKHYLRDTKTLDGQWGLYFDEDDHGVGHEFYKNFPAASEAIHLPSCWNFKEGRYEYDGVAWFRKKFHYSKCSPIYLSFEAVSGYKQVWLDGDFLGDHYGSFTEFSFLTNELSPGMHEVVVRVDNCHDDTTLPRPYVDWKIWGGIYRSVQYFSVQGMVISRMFIDVSWDGYDPIAISIRVRVINSCKHDLKVPCSIYFDGKEIFKGNVDVEASGGDIELGKFNIRDVELWSPQTPNLYTVRVVCGNDDIIDNIGFRKIETAKGKILLNGKAVKMLGINRHHTHPSHGFAIPASLSERDIDIIQAANINSIRGSHYPNEPFFLDLCDQRGVLFWAEIPFWQHPAESLGDPVLQQRSLNMMREMIERDYNHPSIIFWSIQNESRSDTPEGKKLFRKLSALTKQLDDSRLVTMATNCQYRDLCYEFVDVIGVNCYHGWYEGKKKEEWIGELIKLKAHLKNNGFGDKPLMITEFGASAYLGERGFERQRKHSEEYQADLLEYIINLLRDDDQIAGLYVWQYCDIRTAKSLERPRGYNSKGILDENRKPKLAYRKVKERYAEFDEKSYI